MTLAEPRASLAGLTQPPAFKLYRLFWEAVDWVFPPQCGGCKAVGERWCRSCRDSAVPMSGPICLHCGALLREGSQCADCQKSPPAYASLRSCYVFDGALRSALHRLKYSRDIGLGEALAQPLTALLAQLDWPVDLITSVPLGKTRLAERGYNQSTLLARPLALARRLSFSSRCLTRTRDTASQVTLTAAERRTNVQGAFWANPALVKGKSILVVDDITTTGSTIQACALALSQAGAKACYGLTVARANYVSLAA